jgi:hypothetical protein
MGGLDTIRGGRAMAAHVHVPGPLDHIRDRIAGVAETLPTRMVGAARTLLVYGLASLTAGALLGMAATLDVWLVALLTALVMFVLAAAAALAALVGLIARIAVRPRR